MDAALKGRHMNNSEIASFFRETSVSIYGNSALRDPQREGYDAIQRYFQDSDKPCYVQLPVGCGKTGLVGLTPFGLASGRVLIVAPNLTIRMNIIRELDVSNMNCFYRKRGVFLPTKGPYVTELKTGANLHDCDRRILSSQIFSNLLVNSTAGMRDFHQTTSASFWWMKDITMWLKHGEDCSNTSMVQRSFRSLPHPFAPTDRSLSGNAYTPSGMLGR